MGSSFVNDFNMFGWTMLKAYSADPCARQFFDVFCNHEFHTYLQRTASFYLQWFNIGQLILWGIKLIWVLYYIMISHVETDTEIGLEVKERRKNRKQSVVPMISGLQPWVEKTGLSAERQYVDGRKSSTSELVPVRFQKKRATYEELRELVNAGKIKEAKNTVRDSDWDLKEEIRSRLWPLLDSIHESNRSSLEGFYWDTATQLYGTEQGQFSKWMHANFHINCQPNLARGAILQ